MFEDIGKLIPFDKVLHIEYWKIDPKAGYWVHTIKDRFIFEDMKQLALYKSWQMTKLLATKPTFVIPAENLR